MLRTVELPLWLLVLILAFAAVTFASHFLFPSVRWFFRRRMERVVARLNTRLALPIQPFKLAARQDMIQRLIYDPQVAEAIAEHAADEEIPEAVAFESAQRYAREIVPSFSASLYFGVATRAARWLSRFLYDVTVESRHDTEIAAIDPDATVVFIMNHRSNMDYVLITYLVANRSALSYAVGEWARIWPLSRLIRAMGAFFIRRRSRNALYRRVLARYVQLATKGGVTQAIFPEGGLSLDGAVGPPKLGLLSYIVGDFDGQTRDVVFVPVGLNYDRVLEDRVLVDAAAQGERRFRASVSQGLLFALRYLGRRMLGRVGRFGKAAVGFGAPLSLRAFLSDTHSDPIKAVGEELRARVEAVVPPLPVPLAARALLQANGPVLRVSFEREAADGVTILLARGLVTEGPDGVVPRPEEAALLRYYANSVAHLAGSPGIVQMQRT